MSIRPSLALKRFPIRRFVQKSQSTAFLRNEFRCRVEYLGRRYYSAAHALLAAQSMDKADHRMIAETVSIRKARSIAAAITHKRPLWTRHRGGILLGILESKFSDPVLAQQLIETGVQPLIHEGDDPYWDYQKATNSGMNMLGQLLMLVRDNLQSGQHGAYSEWRRKETARIKAWRKRKTEEAKKSRKPRPPLPRLPWRSRNPKEGIDLYYNYPSKTHADDRTKHGRWTPTLEQEIKDRVAAELVAYEASKAKKADARKKRRAAK